METAIPDIYADGANVSGGPYGLTVTLLLSVPPMPGEERSQTVVGRIRLSNVLAAALGDALGKAAAPVDPTTAVEA